jgi:hypothetical protein
MVKSSLARNPLSEVNKPERFLTVLDVAFLISVKTSTVYQ